MCSADKVWKIVLLADERTLDTRTVPIRHVIRCATLTLDKYHVCTICSNCSYNHTHQITTVYTKMPGEYFFFFLFACLRTLVADNNSTYSWQLTIGVNLYDFISVWNFLLKCPRPDVKGCGQGVCQPTLSGGCTPNRRIYISYCDGIAHAVEMTQLNSLDFCVCLCKDEGVCPCPVVCLCSSKRDFFISIFHCIHF